MSKKNPRLLKVHKKGNTQHDAQCWKYYHKTFNIEYTLQNRSRLLVSKLEQERIKKILEKQKEKYKDEKNN